jgi:DNA polymerase-3 subunit beta
MKITIKRKELANIATIVSKTAIKPSKNSDGFLGIESDGKMLHIFGKDLFDDCIGTDMQIAIPNSEKFDMVYLDAKLLTGILKKLKSPTIELTIDDTGNVLITGGKTTCGMKTVDVSDIEKPCYENFKPVLEISEKKLRDMLEATLFAIRVDTLKSILTGECFEVENNTFSIISCCEYRMALETTTVQQAVDSRFIVPANALKQLLNVLGDGVCKVSLAGELVCFTGDNYKVSSKLIEGNFPNYEAWIPSEVKIISTVKSDDIKEYVDLTKLFKAESKVPVICTIEDNVMTFSYETGKGLCEKKIEADISGGEIKIGMAADSLLDFVKHMKTNKVTLSFKDCRNVIIFTADERPSFTGVLMPIFLRNE